VASELVASRRGAAGAGVRCHDVEETLSGAVCECALSRLCHPGGLETGGGGGKRLVAAAVVRRALASGRSGARLVDGAGAEVDRGLYAPWLYQHSRSLGWHLFMRINTQGNFRPLTEKGFHGLGSAAPSVGCAWCGYVECFSDRLACTLLARWDEGYDEVWLIVTDLALEQASALWYGLRSSIEASFKDTKRGGWHWHHTKMLDPARAERLWLAIAVTTVWVLSVGGQADARLPVSSLETLPPTHIARRKAHAMRNELLTCSEHG
jgi:DDE family transposase